jgi:hypothetical protein
MIRQRVGFELDSWRGNRGTVFAMAPARRIFSLPTRPLPGGVIIPDNCLLRIHGRFGAAATGQSSERPKSDGEYQVSVPTGFRTSRTRWSPPTGRSSGPKRPADSDSRGGASKLDEVHARPGGRGRAGTLQRRSRFHGGPCYNGVDDPPSRRKRRQRARRLVEGGRIAGMGLGGAVIVALARAAAEATTRRAGTGL